MDGLLSTMLLTVEFPPGLVDGVIAGVMAEFDRSRRLGLRSVEVPWLGCVVSLALWLFACWGGARRVAAWRGK